MSLSIKQLFYLASLSLVLMSCARADSDIETKTPASKNKEEPAHKLTGKELITGYFDETLLLTFNEVLGKYTGYIKADCSEEKQLNVESCNCRIFFISSASRGEIIQGDTVEIVLYGSDSLKTYKGRLYPKYGGIKIQSLGDQLLFPCERWVELSGRGTLYDHGPAVNQKNITVLLRSGDRMYDEPFYSAERTQHFKKDKLVEIIEKRGTGAC